MYCFITFKLRHYLVKLNFKFEWHFVALGPKCRNNAFGRRELDVYCITYAYSCGDLSIFI